jgi:hypothetical protein
VRTGAAVHGDDRPGRDVRSGATGLHSDVRSEQPGVWPDVLPAAADVSARGAGLHSDVQSVESGMWTDVLPAAADLRAR